MTDDERAAYEKAKRSEKRVIRLEWVRRRLARSTRAKIEIAREVEARYDVTQRTGENDVKAAFESMTITIGRRRELRHRLGEAFARLLELHDGDERTPLRDQVVLLNACRDYWKLGELEAEEVLERPELEDKFVDTLENVFPQLSAENQERVRAIVKDG